MADTVANAVLSITGTNSGGAVVDALEDLLDGITATERERGTNPTDRDRSLAVSAPGTGQGAAQREPVDEEKASRTIADFADARSAWMMQQGGLDTLPDSLRLSAERSYEKWPGDHEQMPLASYVEYVQQHWHKELNALGGSDALETYLADRETIRARDVGPDTTGKANPGAADYASQQGVDLDSARDKTPKGRASEAERASGAETQDKPRERAERPREPFSAEGVLSAAHRRLSVLERDATAATTHGVEQSRAQRLPTQDVEPHRRELLSAAMGVGPEVSCPPHLRASYTKLDWQLDKIRNQILKNPMWRSSAFLARQSPNSAGQANDFRTDRDAQAAVPELRETIEQLKRVQALHQRDLAASQKAINRLESLQRATGALAWIRRNVFKAEASRTRQAEHATYQEHTSERNLRACEQRAKQLHAAYTNVQRHDRHAQREVARTRLREIEEPFRSALLERVATEYALHGGRARVTPEKLPVGEILTCQAVDTTPGGFCTFVMLETDRSERVVLDAAEHKSSASVKPGDQIRVRRDAHGSLDLAMHQRARGPDLVEGVVASISRDGDRVRELVVRNEQTGKERTVRPEKGRDLADEYPSARATLQQLREGDSVTIRPGSRTIEVSRTRDRGRGR